jgi:hypothetical protein
MESMGRSPGGADAAQEIAAYLAGPVPAHSTSLPTVSENVTAAALTLPEGVPAELDKIAS